MKYVELDGARISRIGLGTWQFGSREWGYGEDYAGDAATRIVTRALELGINLVDTAEIYAFGRSEKIVGQAVAGRRESVFLATKVLPVVPLRAVVEWRGRGSARRLGTESIDLYQLHWPNPVVPLQSQLAGMRRLRDAGIVSRIGVSNYSLALWKAADRALRGPVFSNQVRYNLLWRKPEADLVPFAQRNGRLVIAYSPLAQGMLSGRYDSGSLPRGTMRRLAFRHIGRAEPVIEELRAIAERHGATPSQVALAWLIRRPNVVAIPGASSVEQLEKNAAAGDLDLADEEDARLASAALAYEQAA
jgi:aryl-alcohol dehydrogenase-like predicted oxidoreductase